MVEWRLITGATGLLGQYLLCDALRNREAVAVLVRDRRGMPAVDRIDRLLAVWEERLGVPLERPVVISGDIRKVDLGLSRSRADWIRRNVSIVIHSAASLRFEETSSHEPMRSNVDGTRHLLRICRDSRVQEFHHISSAFSFAQSERASPVQEELHRREAPFGNVYEQSKCLSEYAVVQAEGGFSRTIYRPSVIIGESTTGYSPSFNAIYTPLRLAWTLLSQSPGLVRSAKDLLDQLGLRGDESRNLVPVDWVSESIGSMIRNIRCHGGIYHLTNPLPTEGRSILSAMDQSISECENLSLTGHMPSSDRRGEELAEFGRHMQTYRSYFVSDPLFDNTKFRLSSGCPPCPRIGSEILARAFAVALDRRFRSRDGTTLPVLTSEPRSHLSGLAEECRPQQTVARPKTGKSIIRTGRIQESDANQILNSGNGNCERIDLTLSGVGGGRWAISISEDQLECRLPGEVSNDQDMSIYGNAAVFRAWLNGMLSFEAGVRAGAFIIEGENLELQRVCRAMEKMRTLFVPAATSFTSNIDTEEQGEKYDALSKEVQTC